MRAAKIVAILAVIGLASTTQANGTDKGAAKATYKECEVRGGKVRQCPATTYSGRAVVLKGDTYHLCSITNGRIGSCPANGFTGDAVVLKGEKLVSCEIKNGRVGHCSSGGYSGDAVTVVAYLGVGRK